MSGGRDVVSKTRVTNLCGGCGPGQNLRMSDHVLGGGGDGTGDQRKSSFYHGGSGLNGQIFLYMASERRVCGLKPSQFMHMI